MLFRIWLISLVLLITTSCVTVDHRSLEVQIPVNASETSLYGSVFFPPGEGPFPIAVLNHGTPASASGRAQFGKWIKPEPINALVERGFIVMVPIRRGFGATGGQYNGSLGSCKDPDFYNGSLGAAEDIVAAIQYAKKIPSGDASRLLLIGHSAGGIASLAAASLESESVSAVVNFSGGRGSGRSSSIPGVPCFPERMANAIGSYAKGITAPVLWYYAENDTFFGPETVRGWFNSFKSNGGSGELVIHPPTSFEGHYVLMDSGGSKYWGPVLDEFLATHGFKVP